MAANKININDIPSDVLGELRALLPETKKTYINVGSNIYEINPAPAIDLMEAMAVLTDLLNDLRSKKIELLKSEVPDLQRQYVQVAIKDIINSSTSGPSLYKVLEKLLTGVDKADLEAMSVGQMLVAIDKAIKINMDTLPPSFREGLPTQMQDEPVAAQPEEEDSKNR